MTREDDIKIRQASTSKVDLPIVPAAANTAFNNLRELGRFTEYCWRDFKVLIAGGSSLNAPRFSIPNTHQIEDTIQT